MGVESNERKKYTMAVESQEEKEHISIDKMVQHAGEFKLFQWSVGGLFCIMMIPSTFQILIMQFGALNSNWRCVANSTVCTFNGTLSPKNNSRCSFERSEWEFTEPRDYSIVTYFDIYCDKEWVIELSQSILFLGSIVGSVILGWGADTYGRKVIIFISMGSILILGFINSFLTNLTLFVAFRFAIGVFIPGTNIQMSVLLSEMTGSRFRPLAGNLSWTFFPVSLCIMSAKAYFIRTWKLLFIVCTAPYIFVMAFYMFVPESVRWLRLHDRISELMKLFDRIARCNNKQIPTHVTISRPDDTALNRISNPTDLFRTRKILLVTLNQGYGLFMHGMVYYGLSLAAGELGSSIYLSFFLLSFIEIPAGLLSIYVCHLARKVSTITGVIISGTACVVLAIIPREYIMARIVFAMLGKLCIALSFNTIGIWAMELYPTAIRGQGMGFLNIVCRIGAASAPWLITGLDGVHESAQFICMGVTALTSSALLCFLPETKGLPMLETLASTDESTILDDVSCPTEDYI